MIQRQRNLSVLLITSYKCMCAYRHSENKSEKWGEAGGRQGDISTYQLITMKTYQLRLKRIDAHEDGGAEGLGVRT